MQARPDPGGNADQHPDQHSPERQRQGHRQGVEDGIDHGLAVVGGGAEVALHGLEEPASVLDDERIVETEFVAEFLVLLRGRIDP